MFPVGIEYVLPSPTVAPGFGSGWIRRILPIGLLVLAEVACASLAICRVADPPSPAIRSSIGG
jgi:hypothetical protein